ncbi:tRNA-splicing endonuclease subunit Sen2 [Spea bombifrons]|uniref:tRNA-splicing endonuclease subunit Sen2 n=1 Tax=Spea bombifrons TaxID=233779 RepID=UPI00234B2FDA|nr:tRNA-splicing endonuclease subunit Sen2 [Spea bombifrons]
MQAAFHAPRRKRTVYEAYESPLPLPLSHDSRANRFRVCRAEIVNNHVTVTSAEDIELLYTKGYFGKGILSRSRPQYDVTERELLMRWRATKVKFPVISSRKYRLHADWARGMLEAQGLDSDSVSRILADYTRPLDVPAGDADPGLAAGAGDEAAREGDPAHDPLARYGPDAARESDEVGDRAPETPQEMRCHKHDDFIVHCGCRPQKRSKPIQPEPEPADPTGNRHQYVLVEEEEETSETADAAGEIGARRLLVCRRNPFRLLEYLQLSREEAFFLTYALGCLSVSYNKEPLTILELWEAFVAAQPTFPATYMAYHHFRSKGWVPKVGLKYGTDLLLYRKGPPFYHASYSVFVELVDSNFEGSPLRPLTWKALAGLNRTTVNVSKELLFCYLIKPPAFTDRDLRTPECIKTFKVQELILSRWISSRERSDQEEEL